MPVSCLMESYQSILSDENSRTVETSRINSSNYVFIVIFETSKISKLLKIN
jgi:hypothetical protein